MGFRTFNVMEVEDDYKDNVERPYLEARAEEERESYKQNSE
jgi:hypothetical protein